MAGAKSFDITKREVWDAYKRIKANRGAAGVDGVSIAEFDRQLSKNLYRIWNRMASGSYFPPPVKELVDGTATARAGAVPRLVGGDTSGDDRSRMSREAHVRFWESAGVRFPCATRQPLYRPHQRLQDAGVTLSRSTLTQWVQKGIELLRPIDEAQLFASHPLLSDLDKGGK